MKGYFRIGLRIVNFSECRWFGLGRVRNRLGPGPGGFGSSTIEMEPVESIRVRLRPPQSQIRDQGCVHQVQGDIGWNSFQPEQADSPH